MRAFFLILFPLVCAASPLDADLAEAVRRCADKALPDVAVLFERLNDPLLAHLRGHHRLCSDDAAEVAQRTWTGILDGSIALPSDFKNEGQLVRWLGATAYHLHQHAKERHRDRAFAPRDLDLGQGNGSPATLSAPPGWASFLLLPDRLHRILLLRVQEGRTYEEIAEEFGKHWSWVSQNLHAARSSLTKVQRGELPIVGSIRTEGVLARTEEIHRKLVQRRPSRMPTDATKLTEEEFRDVIRGFSPLSQQVAWKYFVEGKNSGTIMAELSVPQSKVFELPRTVANAVTRRYSPDGRRISVESIWVVDAAGFPISPFRQADRANPPKDPVAVSAAEFWRAIEDWNLDAQQAMHMRFVERLTPTYIAFAVGRPVDAIQGVIEHGLEKLNAGRRKKVTAANLEIVGATDWIQIEPVELPARMFLTFLETGGPSTETKLHVASQFSGIRMRNLQCVVLVDEAGIRLTSYQQRDWAYPTSTPVVPVTLKKHHRALAPLDEDRARVGDLFIRHRWSYSTIKFYLSLSDAQMKNYMESVLRAYRRELALPELSLTQVEVSGS